MVGATSCSVDCGAYACDTSTGTCYTYCPYTGGYCANTVTYWCDTNTASSTYGSCQIKSCTDTDGSSSAYTTVGTVSGGTLKGTSYPYSSAHTDSCGTAGSQVGKLLEYYCSDSTHWYYTVRDCATDVGTGSTCSAGVCTSATTRSTSSSLRTRFHAAEYDSESFLPWILGGVGLLLLVGIMYWHFRKNSSPKKRK